MIQKVPNEIFKETKQKKNNPAAKAVCLCIYFGWDFFPDLFLNAFQSMVKEQAACEPIGKKVKTI